MQALRTARLVLDTPRETDIPAVLQACSDPELLRWIPLPQPYTLENAEFFVRSYCPHGLASGRFTVWAVRQSDTLPLVGVVEVRRDEAAGLWYAMDTGELGIVTEAETLEALRERLKQLLPECFGIEDCPVELELCDAENGEPA